MSKTEEYLIETADRCIRLAKAGREIAADLEAISNDLMAKAVELDTTKDRDERQREANQPIASPRAASK
jgi:hypothetical protein